MVKRYTTVVQINQFEARAKGRMTAAEIDAVTGLLATDPPCGDLIQGTGGIRKVRIAVKGKGKSGGVRVVYYYYNETLPIFLLTVFAKNEKDNLTKAERNT
ncbi:MAG: type II toxin-antitoxin system RelE/ParE family toxin, partial [Proteobacteria bacterium]|nr:type II toxin-antitoxin system RelE/ParE family toxin [Pseudomonadota bacterium]